MDATAPGAIRAVRVEDAAAIAAIYAPEVEHGTATFETDPPPPAEIAQRIAAILPIYPWLVWDEGGSVLGYAYASRHRDRRAYRWSVDTAIYVSPDARGKGVARTLYAELFAVATRQGFHAAFAAVASPNPPSEALHAACGFELIGVYREVGYKLGAWRDVGWWRRELAPASGQPAEPIPFAQLKG